MVRCCADDCVIGTRGFVEALMMRNALAAPVTTETSAALNSNVLDFRDIVSPFRALRLAKNVEIRMDQFGDARLTNAGESRQRR